MAGSGGCFERGGLDFLLFPDCGLDVHVDGVSACSPELIEGIGGGAGGYGSLHPPDRGLPRAFYPTRSIRQPAADLAADLGQRKFKIQNSKSQTNSKFKVQNLEPGT